MPSTQLTERRARSQVPAAELVLQPWSAGHMAGPNAHLAPWGPLPLPALRAPRVLRRGRSRRARRLHLVRRCSRHPRTRPPARIMRAQRPHSPSASTPHRSPRNQPASRAVVLRTAHPSHTRQANAFEWTPTLTWPLLPPQRSSQPIVPLSLPSGQPFERDIGTCESGPWAGESVCRCVR